MELDQGSLITQIRFCLPMARQREWAWHIHILGMLSEKLHIIWFVERNKCKPS